jgi:hypothetical protein
VRVRWQDPCRVAHRHPANGHRSVLWKLGEEVHRGVDPHLGSRADDGAVEHLRACSKERAVAYGTAGKVRAGANEQVIADGRQMPFGAADNGILHDDTSRPTTIGPLSAVSTAPNPTEVL